MNESDDDEGMPSLVHDSSENSSGDESKPRKDKTKKKKKKKKPPPPGSSDDEGEPGPQTGGVGLRKGFLEQDDARGAASSSAAAASGDGLADLTPKALKDLITSAGLSTDGCIDKSDLVEQARKAKAKLAEQQVAAERERVRREEDERARAAEAESRRKREEERAAREEVQRKRDEEKRLADEHASMAKLLNECGVLQRAQSAARPLVPQLATRIARDARLRAWAAPHSLEARLGRSDPRGSSWCGRQRVPRFPMSTAFDRPTAFDHAGADAGRARPAQVEAEGGARSSACLPALPAFPLCLPCTSCTRPCPCPCRARMHTCPAARF